MPDATADRKVLQVEVRGGTQVARKEVRYQGTAAVVARQPWRRSSRPTTSTNGSGSSPRWSSIRSSSTTRWPATAPCRSLPEPVRFEGDAARRHRRRSSKGRSPRLTEVRYDGVDRRRSRPAVADAGRLPERTSPTATPTSTSPDGRSRRRTAGRLQRRRRHAHGGHRRHDRMPASVVVRGRARDASSGWPRWSSRARCAAAPNRSSARSGSKPGAPVDYAQWAQARKRVFDTNVFRQVEVTPEEVPGAAGGPEQVNARVTVTEWPTWRLRYGLQLNDRDQSDFDRAAQPGPRRRRRHPEPQRARPRLHLRPLRPRRAPPLLEQRLSDVPDVLRPRGADQRLRARARARTSFLGGQPPSRCTRTVSDVASIEQRIRRTRSFEITYGYRLTNARPRRLRPRRSVPQRDADRALHQRARSSTAATIRSTPPAAGSRRPPPSGSASSTAAAIRSSCSAPSTPTGRSAR